MEGKRKVVEDVLGMAGGAFSLLRGVGEEMRCSFRGKKSEGSGEGDLLREELSVMREALARERREREELEARIATLEGKKKGKKS